MTLSWPSGEIIDARPDPPSKPQPQASNLGLLQGGGWGGLAKNILFKRIQFLSLVQFLLFLFFVFVFYVSFFFPPFPSEFIQARSINYKEVSLSGIFDLGVNQFSKLQVIVYRLFCSDSLKQLCSESLEVGLEPKIWEIFVNFWLLLRNWKRHGPHFYRKRNKVSEKGSFMSTGIHSPAEHSLQKWAVQDHDLVSETSCMCI